MAGIEFLAFFVLVPLLASAIGWILLRRSAARLILAPTSDGISDSMRRVAVAGAVLTVPSAIGFVLWLTVAPVVDTLYGPVRYSPSEATLLYVAAAVYAWAAVSSVLSSTIVFRGRFRSMLGPEFGRVLTIAVIPLTSVIFCTVLEGLVVGILAAEVQGSGFVDITQIPAAMAAFEAFSIACIAFPVAAWVSNRIRDLSGRGFVRPWR